MAGIESPSVSHGNYAVWREDHEEAAEVFEEVGRWGFHLHPHRREERKSSP